MAQQGGNMKQRDIWITEIQSCTELTQFEKDDLSDLIAVSRCDSVAEVTYKHIKNNIIARRGVYQHDERD